MGLLGSQQESLLKLPIHIWLWGDDDVVSGMLWLSRLGCLLLWKHIEFGGQDKEERNVSICQISRRHCLSFGDTTAGQRGTLLLQYQSISIKFLGFDHLK